MKRNVVKWLGVGVGTIALGGTSLASLLWQRTLILPSWYRPQSSVTPTVAIAPSPSPSPRMILPSPLGQAMPAAIQKQFQSQGKSGTGTLQLAAPEVNQWLGAAIAQSPDYPALKPALRGMNTEIQQGTLTSGLVIDTRQLSLKDLSPDLRRSLENTFSHFPMLKERELYIGLTGSPRIENNRLIPNAATQLQIGSMTLPLPEAMRLFGISQKLLEIPVNGKAWNLKVQNAEVKEEILILKGEIVP
jgi:hypothetical protein